MIQEGLLRRALEGEPSAFKAVLRDLIVTSPPAVARAYRDEMIRLVAAWLADAVPDPSPRKIAVIIREAATSLMTKRRLSARRPFHVLSVAEIERLETEIEIILGWHSNLPALRQLYTILRA